MPAYSSQARRKDAAHLKRTKLVSSATQTRAVSHETRLVASMTRMLAYRCKVSPALIERSMLAKRLGEFIVLAKAASVPRNIVHAVLVSNPTIPQFEIASYLRGYDALSKDAAVATLRYYRLSKADFALVDRSSSKSRLRQSRPASAYYLWRSRSSKAHLQ